MLTCGANKACHFVVDVFRLRWRRVGASWLLVRSVVRSPPWSCFVHTYCLFYSPLDYKWDILKEKIQRSLYGFIEQILTTLSPVSTRNRQGKSARKSAQSTMKRGNQPTNQPNSPRKVLSLKFWDVIITFIDISSSFSTFMNATSLNALARLIHLFLLNIISKLRLILWLHS